MQWCKGGCLSQSLKGFKLFWDGTTTLYRKKPTLTARGERVDAIRAVLSQGQIIYQGQRLYAGAEGAS